jgi:hypothetical protein
MATRLAVESGKDFLDTSVLAWFVMPFKLISRSDYSDLGTALLISLGVVGSVILFEYLRKDRTPQQEEDSDPVFAKQLIVIGALLLVFAILPVVFSGREVDLYDSYKSYGLHVIGGVVMLILGLLDYLKPNFRKVVFYSLLVLAVSTQILNTFEWRGLWQAQRDVWWQLSWRAPGLEENTALFVQLPGGFALEQDYESWGPANLIYAPHEDRLFVQSEVLNDEMAMNILNGTKKTARVRDVSFPLNFRNALILSTPSLSACLHVIDGNMPFYSESERALVKLVGENSNISRVIPTGDSPIPPEAIFGAEPEHTWCYYYQKAALAKQTGNWEEVIQIYQTAEELGFEPKDRVEWMPLIEAYVNLGKLEETQALIERIRTKRSFELSICSQLSQPLYTQLPEYDFIYTNFCEWEE